MTAATGSQRVSLKTNEKLHRQEDADLSEATQCNIVVSIPIDYSSGAVVDELVPEQRKAEDLLKRTWHVNMDKKKFH